MALRTTRKTRSSRTWRTQELLLHPPSGQVGSQMMAHVVGLLPMGRSLLSPMWLSMHHVESNLDHPHPRAPSHLHHHHHHRLLPHQACARPWSVRTMTELICSRVPSTPAALMNVAASAPLQTAVLGILGFTTTMNAG